jgi:alcohol dehydrogenase
LLLAGLAIDVDHETPHDPSEDDVDRLAARVAAWDADVVVAVGGGSAIDAAKGAALVARHGGPVGRWWRNEAPGASIPLVAVPTTAGTGSEVQSHAVLRGPVGKRAIGHAGWMPVRTLLVAEALATCPADVVRDAGLDALVHALEVVATTAGDATSRAVGVEAFQGLLDALPAAMRGEAGIDQHRTLLRASCLAGAAIEGSMLGACHALGNALAARFGMSHGLSVAIASRAVVPATVAAGWDAWRPLAARAGVAWEAFPAWWDAFLEGLGAPADATPWGASEGDVRGVAAIFREQWTLAFHPVALGDDVVRAVCGTR